MDEDTRKLYARKELYRMVLETELGQGLIHDLQETFQRGNRALMIESHAKLAYMAAFDDLFEHIRAMLAVEPLERLHTPPDEEQDPYE